MDVSKVWFESADLSRYPNTMAIHPGGTGGTTGTITMSNHGDAFANLGIGDQIYVVTHELVHEAQSKFYGSQADMNARVRRDNAWWPNDQKRYTVLRALERTYYRSSYWADPRYSLESIAEVVSHEALEDYLGIETRIRRR